MTDAHYVDGESYQMQDMLLAIWHQDFDQLIHMQAVGLLVTRLVVILFLESSFVFLPLPGDSLVLLAGGLVGMGVPARGDAALSAARGRVWQRDRPLAGPGAARHPFHGTVERMIPRGAPPRPRDCSIVTVSGPCSSPASSPSSGVLTPMLMGVSRLQPGAGGHGQFRQRLPLVPGAQHGRQSHDGDPGPGQLPRVVDQVPADHLLRPFVIAVAAIGMRLLKRPAKRVR